ncbi:hypothetical protein DH2020_030504 [Rehmannia glutinosa]|uniref:Phosphoinositide-specific phospholipase C EF-hand-like domain-containing protein n=1 Tax=Rehmannia glutinosa TaxID=99300 RepID=A0ABR0VNY1_REHGL
MRSPDRPGFRDEMVGRRRGSPSFVARHPNDLRGVDSGRSMLILGRPIPIGEAHHEFSRNSRRADALDSREMGDGDEYMNGPLHSNKFHEIRGEGSIDERRKFIERRGPIRSFRPSYSDEGDNFRFHPSNGPRPFRFCPDADTEFVERSNMREREFDGRMKHQPLVVSRRIRNIEEEQDVNYRPIERQLEFELENVETSKKEEIIVQTRKTGGKMRTSDVMGSYNYYKMFGCFNRKFKISESEPPPDVREAFWRYADGGAHMTADQLRNFMVQHQREEGCTAVDVEGIMQHVFNHRHHAERRHHFTLEDFFYFLFHDDLNGPINPQTMLPLTNRS